MRRGEAGGITVNEPNEAEVGEKRNLEKVPSFCWVTGWMVGPSTRMVPQKGNGGSFAVCDGCPIRYVGLWLKGMDLSWTDELSSPGNHFQEVEETAEGQSTQDRTCGEGRGGHSAKKRETGRRKSRQPWRFISQKPRWTYKK